MIEIKDKSLSGYKFIDLFAGLGGFRLALESLGAECVFSSDWDESVRKVYCENFGTLPQGDITKIDENSIPDHDILCAGFPCQPFSISGKQRGFDDERGTLILDVVRIIKAKRPKVVFMENVKNFASHDDGRTLEFAKTTLEDLGYSFDQRVLNAANFGIPQKRERIYMLAFRKDLHATYAFPKPIKLERHVEDFLLSSGEIDADLYIDRADTQLNSQLDDRYSTSSIRLGIVNKGGQGERIYSTKGIAITLSANGGGVFSKTGGYLVDGKTRKLHPRECARLMGFPDSYKIAKTRNQAYKQFGNSVVVDVLQYLAIEVSNSLKRAKDERA